MKIIDKTNLPLIGLISLCVGFWTSVWFYGFFMSIMALVIITSIVGIWLSLTGRI